MGEACECVRRIPEATLASFHEAVLRKLGTPPETARLAVRSMIEASLMGIDTHGVEALDMYVDHIRAGGLAPGREPTLVAHRGGLLHWDMQDGFGLASARKIMGRTVAEAREHGVALSTCRNANHIGACGVYSKLAADVGLIGMVSQQTLATLAPWGGTEARIGASPVAFAAPVMNRFPFCYDGSFAMITRAQIRAHMREGRPLPDGVALDACGRPTTDPREAWEGQVMPIGHYKGVALAMVMEVLSCVLSGNVFAGAIPSIVTHPDRPARSSLFMLVVDPSALWPGGDFAVRMREYVEYVESSPARDPSDPPRCPGRLAGERWADRSANGIPVSDPALARFDRIASALGIEPISP